ncbi:MAG TPA: hypothetical protein VGB79_00740, partial [Allosphingosinicella sp.]
MVDQVTLLAREGGEFVVNTVTAGDQLAPRIAKLASGGYVVIWTDNSGQTDTSGSGVKAQVYDSAGVKVGAEILVNTTTAGSQFAASVVGLANGGFMVNWAGSPEGGAQIFDAAGAKVGGEFVPFSGTTAGAAAAAVGNDFVLVRDTGTGQLFDAAGAKIGSTFQVGDPTKQDITQVVALAGGGFAVVTTDRFTTPGLRIQIFDINGQKIGAELAPEGFQGPISLSTAALSGGGFVVGFSESGALHAQRFDAAGSAVGARIRIDPTFEGAQTELSLVGVPGDGFLASWRQDSSGGIIQSFIKGQAFDGTGAPAGAEFTVNTQTDHPNLYHVQPAMALIGGDRVAIVWHGAGPGDARNADWTVNNIHGGIRGQILKPAPDPVMDISVSKSSVSEIAVEGVAAVKLSTASTAVNSSYTYTILSDSTGGAFQTVGDLLVVADSDRLDFETAPTASVTVQVTDTDGNVRTETFEFAVTDAAPEQRLLAGAEKTVNTQQSQEQNDAQIARSGNGFVVVWTDQSHLGDGTGTAIKAQLYNANGNAVGGEFRVNTNGNSIQDQPAVATLASGGFAVAWRDWSGHGGDTDFGISFQLFDSAGVMVGGQVLANTVRQGPQDAPSIAGLAGGGFVITWTTISGYSSSTGLPEPSELRAQLFDAAGAKVGGEIPVNTTTANDQNQSAVAALAGGGFMVAWRDASLEGGDASGTSIKAQRFDAAGAKVGSEVLVNTLTQGSQTVPSIAAAADGSVLVVWQATTAGARGQLFDAQGNKSGGELLFEGLTTAPHVSAAPAGGWLVVGAGSAGGIDTSGGLVGQRLAADGAKVGDVFLINQTIFGSQHSGAATILGSGTIAATWTDGNSSVADINVKLRLFSSTELPVARNDAFATGEAAVLTGSLFSDNGSGPDSGATLEVTEVNGSAALLGQPVTLASGAKVTVNADGSVSYDPAGVHDALAPAGSGAANAQATETFTYTIAGGSAATVTIVVNGAASAGDRYLGTPNGDAIIGTDAANVFLVQQGGPDNILAGGGDDAIFVGAKLDPASVLDGGAGFDTLFLQGGPAHTLTAANLQGIDKLVLLSAGDDRFGTAGNGWNSYNLTVGDSALGAGRVLEIDGSGLPAVASGEAIVLAAAAETDARYIVRGGANTDLIDTGAGDDELNGGAGNDYLNGGGGADLMRGGTGDDTFFVGHPGDVVVENGQEGDDTVRVSLESYMLAANVENMVGTRQSGQALTGNALRNFITGEGGNDLLDGGAGEDFMTGGVGDDVYVIDHVNDRANEESNQGIDEIRTALASLSLGSYHSIENLTGTSAGGQTLTGTGGDNVITGGAGNDILNGNGGTDLLRGRGGNDLYYVMSPGTTVEEADGEGIDEVRTDSAAYTLASNFEVLTGVRGGGQALTGNALDNIVTGGAGNDVIDGGAGADTMSGGDGNDIYYVDRADDVIVETSTPFVQNVDEVRTALQSYTLENFRLENLTGLSDGGQVLTGNGAFNIIVAGGGNDVIEGAGNADLLVGGGGADRFVYRSVWDSVDGSRDRIAGFEQGIDKVDLMALGVVRLSFTQGMDGIGAYTLVTAKGAGVQELTIRVDGTLGEADILAETGIVGTNGDDVLGGTAEADSIRGEGGNDALSGLGAGDLIDGGTGNDVIDGGEGADTMRGGMGDDVFLVDQAGDTVVENAGEGTDEVRTALGSYGLGANIERLTGTLGSGQVLTGNGLGNTIRGGDGADTLYGEGGDDALYGGAGNDAFNAGGGNDLIDGGTGADVMGGLSGNDVFIVDDAGDQVVEAENDGTDEVRTGLASYSLTANVENLTGTSASGQVLTGNDLANVLFGGMGDDTLIGGAGNDTLIGFGGSDVLRGQAGDDIYFIDAGDTVIELAGDGIDEVRTQATIFVLTDTLENLRAASDIGHDFRGNGGHNVIVGGNGNDIIR